MFALSSQRYVYLTHYPSYPTPTILPILLYLLHLLYPLRAQALQQFQLARESYVEGFHSAHPKVAWAVQGIASLQQQRGELQKSLSHWEEAIRLFTG